MIGATMATASPDQVLENVGELATEWADQRSERQRRRSLDPTDFKRLQAAGFLLTGLPVTAGGLWESVPRSTRTICELLRILAHGDSSVALVCAMHPSVLAFWLVAPHAPAPFQEAWAEQRRHVLRTVEEGAWWGTIVSEPGSGGDTSKTKATARSQPDRGRYGLSGQKHFGSGSGIASYMVTMAVPEGEAEPDVFFLDVRDVPWDGSTGMKLMAEWDGHGMAATQSHAFELNDFPALRAAWLGAYANYTERAAGLVACCFTAVVVGIVEVAVETARHQLSRRAESLHAYEQVEWSRVELEAWLIQQAYEGILHAAETEGGATRSSLLGKTAIAELAESVLTRIFRVVGGSAYSRQTPYGFWLQDVRALGFLRPPWGLAYERISAGSWPELHGSAR